ncbi:MAG: STAS/SEC14 domain-containing protein [Betaproteobacteria bacterium]
MLNYTIMEHDGVLVLTSDSPLNQKDFAGLCATVDAYLAKHEKLRGVLVYAKRFPGWEDVSGFSAHLHFARDHRDKVERIAIATDSMVAGIAESLAKLFTPADVRRFGYSEPDIAMGWLKARAA